MDSSVAVADVTYNLARVNLIQRNTLMLDLFAYVVILLLGLVANGFLFEVGLD